MASNRFPEQFGVGELYKFRPFRSTKDKGRARQILVDHKIWFSSQPDLNDPYDLRPLLRYRQFDSATETRFVLRAEAEVVWGRANPPLTHQQLTRKHERLFTAPLADLQQEALQRVHKRLQEEYWICSLAASRDFVPMWDEYADNRRGICIHFSVKPGSPFRFAQKVNYQSERPVIEVPLTISDHDLGDIATRTKTRRWSLEQEFRLIRYPGQDVNYDNFGLRFDGHLAEFPAASISGVTVGTDMPKGELREILKLRDRHLPGIPVFRPRDGYEAT